ncbi:MAG: complex I subunit 1 family protein [Candidatus Odinarchaeia archaeon]
MAVYLYDLWLIILLCAVLPLIAFFVGIFFASFFRKFTAMLQSRRGPWFIVPKSLRPVVGATRIMQPFWDIMKLMYKQTLIPSVAKRKAFVIAPFFSLACLIIALWFIPIAGVTPLGPFEFGLIIVLYMFVSIPLSLVVSGTISTSPWGVLGSIREVLMTLSYELPFLFGIFSIALMYGLPNATFAGLVPLLPGSLSIWDIVRFQGTYTLNILGFKIPAFFLILNPFAAVAVISSLIGKLGIKPMDIPDAEVEVVSGAYTEYTGKLLGVYEIVKIFLFFEAITLFIDLFIGGGILWYDYFGIPSLVWNAILFTAEAVVIIFILSIIHVANPRFRSDQAFAWYMRWPLILSLIGLFWPYFLAALSTLNLPIPISLS